MLVWNDECDLNVTFKLLLFCISFQISDPEKCDQMYESLARINSNVYRERVSAALHPEEGS